MTNYKVATKVDGKWRTVGNVKKNKWGNYSLGMMQNDITRELLKGDGWCNFALFEDDGERKEKPADYVLEDMIPF